MANYENQGREDLVPEFPGVGREFVIRPSGKTISELGPTVSERLRISGTPGRSTLEQLVKSMSRTPGITFSAGDQSLIARLGEESLHVPLFDKFGRMHRGGSVYSSVGKIFTPSGQGGFRAQTLPEFIYSQAQQAVSGVGPGASPQSKFRALKRSVGSFFSPTKSYIEGQWEEEVAGQAARLFESFYYQGNPLPRHLEEMQRRATFLVPKGHKLYDKLNAYQEALKTLSGVPGRKARFNKHEKMLRMGRVDPKRPSTWPIIADPGERSVYSNWMATRQGAIEAALELDPTGQYSLLGGGQGGRWLFPSINVGTKGLGAFGSENYLPVTLTGTQPEQLMPLAGNFKAGVHHLAHQAFLPIPRGYLKADVLKTTTRNKRYKRLHNNNLLGVANRPHSVFQRSGYSQAIKSAEEMLGHSGTYGVPMKMMALANPEYAEFLLGKSGAVLGHEWGTDALARNHHYTVKLKVAPSGVDMKSLQLFEGHLADPIRIKIKEQIERYENIDKMGYRADRPWEIKLGGKGVIGFHLDDEGGYAGKSMQQRMVKTRRPDDVITGARYLQHSGEMEFDLLGRRELRQAESLVIGGQSTRVGASRNLPLSFVKPGGEVISADIMADVPMFNLSESTGRIAISGTVPELKQAGDMGRYQLQTIGTRVEKRFGIPGLEMLAKSFGGRLEKIESGGRTTFVIEGAGRAKGFNYNTSLDKFRTRLKDQLLRGKSGDKQVDQIFSELTDLTIGRLSPNTIHQLLAERGVTANHPDYHKIKLQLKNQAAYMFEGVPVTVRERFYELQAGRLSNVKFKQDNISILQETLSAYSNDSKSTAEFGEFSRVIHRMLSEENPAVYDDLKRMTRAYIEAPRGIQTTSLREFETALPGEIARLQDYSVEKLQGSVLVDENGRVRTKGFYVKTKDPIKLLGTDAHPVPMMQSDIHYVMSPEAAGFRIDQKSGRLMLNGGHVSAAGGTSTTRAYLELVSSAQVAGGFQKMAPNTVKGRLDALYGTAFDAAIGKEGMIRQSAIRPVAQVTGRVGYLPSLQAGQIGIPSSKIESTLGPELFEQYKQAKKNREKFRMLTRRHPVRAGFQLQPLEVVEIQDQLLPTNTAVNAEEMLYTSKSYHWLAQADADGDTIEAFLLSKNATDLSVEQKAYVRIAAQQKKVNKRVDQALNNILRITGQSETTFQHHMAQMGAIQDQLSSIIEGADKGMTRQVSAQGFEAATRHSALAAGGEVFARSRMPLARHIAKMASEKASQQDVIASIAKFSKEEIGDNLRTLIAELMRPDTAKLMGESARHLVGYQLLAKASRNKGDAAAEGFRFIESIQQFGADVAMNPNLLDDSIMMDKLTQSLYDMADGDKVIGGGALPTSVKALPYIDQHTHSEEALKHYFRTTARITAALEGVNAGADFRSPADVMFGLQKFKVEKAAERGGAGLLAAEFLHEADDEIIAELKNLENDIISRNAGQAGGRAASAGAIYDAAGQSTLAAGGTSARVSAAAEIGKSAAQRISQSRFFKPAAYSLGALAGWEVIKSVFSGGAPSPMAGASAGAGTPPAPLLATPTDSSFDYNYLPQNNVARIERVEGQKVRMNVRAQANAPVDFRGLSSVVVGNYGFQPVQNGTFRDERGGDLSRRDMERYLKDRMNAAF